MKARDQQNVSMDRMISASDTNEIVNVLSHGPGALAAVAATSVLVTLAAREQKWLHLLGFAVYGTTLVLSLGASCLLHSFLLRGRYHRVLGILDHSAIYLLIAGTYTPFCVTILRGATGWLLLASVWSLAVVWIILKAVWFVHFSTTVSNLSYISLGWLVIVVSAPLYRQLGLEAVLVLLAGGGVYTLGAISFQRGRPNRFPPYVGNHELWHGAVLVGSGRMFYVLLRYVLPSPA